MAEEQPRPAEAELHAILEKAAAVHQDLVEILERLARYLPELTSLLEKDGKEMRVLSSFLTAEDATDQPSNLIYDEMKKTRGQLVALAQTIGAMGEADNALFGELANRMEKLATVVDFIREVEAISDDVELLSYNSSFVAIRAGTGGAAFTYIAREIKELAKKTKFMISRMQATIDLLLERSTTIREMLTRQSAIISQRIPKIQQRLETTFEGFNNALQNNSILLLAQVQKSDANILRTGEMVKMLDLQKAEIEKASRLIQQGNRVLSGSPKSFSHAAVVRELEAGLTRSLAALEKQLHRLRDQSAQLENDIEEIRQARGQLVASFLPGSMVHGQQTGTMSLAHRARKVMSELLSFLNESVEGAEEVAQPGSQIVRALRVFRDYFLELDRILKKFALIRVASKMEIARDEELSRNISASAELFDELTGRMQQLIARMKNDLLHFNDQILTSIAGLKMHVAQRRQESKEITEKVSATLQDIEELQDTLKLNVQLSGNYAELIRETIARVKGQIDLGLRVVASFDFAGNENMMGKTRYDTPYSHRR